MTSRNTPTLLNDQLAADLDVEGRHFAAQTLGDQSHGVAAPTIRLEGIDVEEHVEDFFRAITEGPQQDSRGQLATTIDSYEYQVLRIKLKVQP